MSEALEDDLPETWALQKSGVPSWSPSLGFRVQGLGLRVQGLGLRVEYPPYWCLYWAPLFMEPPSSSVQNKSPVGLVFIFGHPIHGNPYKLCWLLLKKSTAQILYLEGPTPLEP